MTDPNSEFEAALEARVRAHLDTATVGVDPTTVAATVVADAERTQPVGRPKVRWLASPPARWRPVAAIAAAVTVAVGALLVGGAPDRPSPSPSPTSAVVAPSTRPATSPRPSEEPALRRLNANGLLAWSEAGAIHVMRPDGSGLAVLEGLPGEDHAPAWSPDGRWIAFFNEDGGILMGRIGMMREDGSEAQVLAGAASGGGPVWSPDGASIAFGSTGERAQTLSVVHLATLRTQEVGFGADADWAPDSRRLVFVQGLAETTIAVTEIGGEARTVTEGPLDGSPDWSPAGDAIAFARRSVDGDHDAIVLMGGDGQGMRTLTDPDSGLQAQGPGFDPFGEQIATTIDRGDGIELALMDADGSDLRRVGDKPWQWAGPTWSPDGRLLLAHPCCRRGGLPPMVIVDAESGVVVFELGTLGSLPSWQPLPYSVSCGPMAVPDCRDSSTSLAGGARLLHPEKRILAVRLGPDCFSHRVQFTDGTTMGGICAAG